MKNFVIIFVVIFGLFAQKSLAQQAKDSKGHFIINSKGTVYVDGVKAGFISKGNIVKNAKGEKIGFINADGTVSDAKGNKMGKAGKDGTIYYNTNGEVAFSVQDVDGETCNILDAKGKVIGNVHDSYKKDICALHCFQHQMNMDKHHKVK